MFRKKTIALKEIWKYPEAKVVKVSVIFTRLNNVDTINERFECEATLFISWDESIDKLKQVEDGDPDTYHWSPESFWDPQLYIDNAIGDVTEKDVNIRLEKHWDQEKSEHYFEVHMIKKIKGVFFEKMELYNFPFDVQDLSLTLTSHLSSNEVYLKQDFNIVAKMNKSASLDRHIWKLYDHVNFKPHMISNDIPQGSDMALDQYDAIHSNSAMSMQCRVSRKPTYFVINCLMPVFMITLCVFFTFNVSHTKYQYRYYLLFYTMLTSITFRWAIHGRVLPTVSYLSFLDVYCVMSISTIFLAMISHTIWLNLHKRDEDLATQYDSYAMMTLSIVVFLALQKKQELEKLDKQAATKYLEHRKSLYVLSNKRSKNPQRVMYNFNKLNGESVIKLANGQNSSHGWKENKMKKDH